MSSLKLQFCKRNMELYSQTVYDYLKEKYPNEKIDVVDCAGTEICAFCTDVPFAVRNNALVGAKTAIDLLYKLERGMEFLENLPSQAKEMKLPEKTEAGA